MIINKQKEKTMTLNRFYSSLRREYRYKNIVRNSLFTLN